MILNISKKVEEELNEYAVENGFDDAEKMMMAYIKYELKASRLKALKAQDDTEAIVEDSLTADFGEIERVR